MKQNTTLTELKKMTKMLNAKSFSAGYGTIQNLVKNEDAVAYNSGTLGWNYDVYLFTYKGKQILIATGVRTPNFKNVSSKLCKKYNDLAYRKSAKYQKNYLNKFLGELC